MFHVASNIGTFYVILEMQKLIERHDSHTWTNVEVQVTPFFIQPKTDLKLCPVHFQFFPGFYGETEEGQHRSANQGWVLR